MVRFCPDVSVDHVNMSFGECDNAFFPPSLSHCPPGEPCPSCEVTPRWTWCACSIAIEKSTDVSRVIKLVACESIKQGNHALQEAKVLQALKHPNVVRYIDVFLHQEENQKVGLPVTQFQRFLLSEGRAVTRVRAQELLVCTVMEFCESGDLSQRLKSMRAKGTQLQEETVRNWLGQVPHPPPLRAFLRTPS